MTNHEGIEKILIEAATKQAIGSHNKPAYTLDHEGRRMQEQERTGIELLGSELTYAKKMIEGRMGYLKGAVASAQHSLKMGTVANERNAEEELQALRAELIFTGDTELTSDELTGAKLAYLKNLVINQMRDLKDAIASAQHSLKMGTAANTRNAEEELQALRADIVSAENLEKKLFQKREADAGAA